MRRPFSLPAVTILQHHYQIITMQTDHLHSSAYEAPEVTITIVAIERGFATSGENTHEGESYDDDAFTSTSY